MVSAVDVCHVDYSVRQTRILSDVTVRIDNESVFALIGPSGCGKSTLLRLISGLERPTSGKVEVFGRPAWQYQGTDRRVATVWQGRALFPHKSVEENISFGLRLRDVEKEGIRSTVEAVAHKLGIERLLRREVRDLSGGEQQRVALARALVVNPDLVLLDEPFTGLDQLLRLELQADLRQLLAKGSRTFVLVSHDFDVVLALADRVAVMQKGHVVQVGRPRDVWKSPVNTSVARWIGWLNVLSQVRFVGSDNGFGRVVQAGGREWCGRQGSALKDSAPVGYLVHPGHIRLDDAGDCRTKGIYRGYEFRETHTMLYFALEHGEGVRVSVDQSDSDVRRLKIGQEMQLSWNSERAVIVPE